MSTLGIKERHHEDVTPPRPWSRASGDVACAAWAKVGMATNPSAVMLVDPRKGETSIGMKMAATRRGEMASSFFIGRWVATTSTRKRRSERRSAWLTCSEPIINHHRSVGGHDFHDFHASGCVPTRKRRSQRRSAWLTCSGASLKTIKSMLRSRCLFPSFETRTRGTTRVRTPETAWPGRCPTTSSDR